MELNFGIVIDSLQDLVIILRVNASEDENIGPSGRHINYISSSWTSAIIWLQVIQDIQLICSE
jgi:hypothetical protein